MNIYLGGYTAKPPAIDGVLDHSEWSSSTSVPTHLGTISVMNDDNNLYVAAKVPDSSLTDRIFEIYFDNTHNGKLDIGDDHLSFEGSFIDGSINFIAENTFGYGADRNGGTIDGSGAATNDGAYNYIEFSHPLCSSDTLNDFCLSTGDVVGFSIKYTKNHFGDSWPVPQSLDAYSWGDIGVAGPEGVEPWKEPPPRSEICGDNIDNDMDGRIDEAEPLAQPGVNWANCNLQNADLQGANLERAFLQFTKFQGANLSGARLTNANMLGVNFENADLSRSNLQEAYLNSADLQGANMQGVDLRLANLQAAVLQRANLDDADLSGAYLWQVSFTGGSLNETSFRGANLTDAYLSGMDLRNVDFRNATLRNTDLSDSNLEGADLSYHDLYETKLFGSNLHDANFVGSILNRVNLDVADLSGADLHNANLRFAYTEGADISGTVLDGPIVPWFTGINLKEGEFFKYSVCIAEYKNCSPYEMTLQVRNQTGGYWNLEIRFIEGGQTIFESVRINGDTAKLLYQDGDSKDIRRKGLSYISFFSSFGNKTHPRDYDAVTWYSPDAPNLPWKLISHESLTIQDSKFNTTIRGIETPDTKYWLANDFPFPIKGVQSKTSSDDNKPSFEFELLEHRQSLVTTSPPSQPITTLSLVDIFIYLSIFNSAAIIFLFIIVIKRKKEKLF